MSSGITPSAAVVPAPLSLPASDTPERAGAGSVARATYRRRLRPLLSALGDVGGILAILYLFPLVILVVGVPVALLVRVLVWLVSAL